MLFMLLLCGLTSYAQETNTGRPDTASLNEVVITASKVPMPQRETAKPVQIIRRADIDARPVRDLAQLLDEVAGLSVNGANSNPGLTKGVYLRGAGSAYTLVLINGQPVSDPSGVGGPVDLRLFPLDEVERIEVLKGSQSTLYGTDAIAGVINIITRGSAEKPLGGHGSLSYGSFNTPDAALGLNGQSGQFDYQASYQRVRTDGISEAADPTGAGNFDRDGYLQQGLQLRAGWKPLPQLRFSPFFRLTDYGGDTDADAFTDSEDRYEARFLNSGVDAQLERNNFTARANYSYCKTERNFFTAFGDFPYHGQFHNAEALISYRIRQPLQILGGVNFQQHRILDNTAAVVNPSIRILSPFITLLLRDLHGFNLEAGYRLNSHSTYGSNSTFSLAPAYQLSKNIRAFGSYTTGFKAPTLYELYGAFGGNENLKPQSSTSWEVGIQGNWFDGRLKAGATFFSRRIRNIIVYSFIAGNFNQDRQDDHGVEAELHWQVLPALGITGQYAYVDGKVATKDELGQDTSYYNLIRRPRNRFSLALHYRPTSKLSIFIQGQYLDRRIDYFFNPQNFYLLETVGLNPYFLLNLSASYKVWGGKISLFAGLRNLTGASFSEAYGYSTPGVNGYAGLRVGF